MPLQIPPSFRIICITNEINLGHLFPLSQELRERFQEIHIGPPNRDLELQILADKIDLRTINNGTRAEFEHHLNQMLLLFEQIRSFGRERALPQLQIGTRSSIQISKTVADQCNETQPQLADLFDRTIRDKIVNNLSFLSAENLGLLVPSIIGVNPYPKLHRAITNLLRQKTILGLLNRWKSAL